MILLLILLLGILRAEDGCIPYAPRVQLGAYYTDLNQQDDMINILFNTKDYCEGAYLTLSGRKFTGTEHKMLNMSEIYKDYEPINEKFHKYDYTYVTTVHRVQLAMINAGETYEYILFGGTGQSLGTFQFTVPLKYMNELSMTRVVVLGDIDSRWQQNNSKPTFDWFQLQAQRNRSEIDAVIFAGDMAYDLESDDCQRGDQFLRNFSTIASSWPTMLTPGNHDAGNNTQFSFYSASFYHPTNQRKGDRDLYSFDIGLVRFIGVNPYRLVYGLADQMETDVFMERLEAELIQAAYYADEIQWIVVYTHYPLVCPDPLSPTCKNTQPLRKRFTQLLEAYWVNLCFAAHEHLYERFYSGEVGTNGIIDYDGTSVVYITEGASGNDKDWNDQTYNDTLPGLQHISYEQSVGVMTALNRSHLLFQQVSTKTNTVIDQFYLRQDVYTSKAKSRVWYFIYSGLIAIGVLVLLVYLCKKVSGGETKKPALASQEYELQEEKSNP